jgi:hypothetical protein
MTLDRGVQVDLAMELLPIPAEQVKRLGSVMVCENKDVEAMKAEFSRLRDLGCECSWMGKEEIQALPGAAVGFDAGIHFPCDSIIDSTAYAQARLPCLPCSWFIFRIAARRPQNLRSHPIPVPATRKRRWGRVPQEGLRAILERSGYSTC